MTHKSNREKMNEIRDALDHQYTQTWDETVKQAWIDAARSWRIEEYGEEKHPKSDE